MNDFYQAVLERYTAKYAQGSSRQLTQVVPTKRPTGIETTRGHNRAWTPEEARKHPRGNPENSGQFAPKASVESMPAVETPIGTVRPANPKLGWKLAEGRTSDPAVVKKMQARADKLGYIADVRTLKFADGTRRYTITLYSRHGEKMKRPDQFYDMDAAGASIAVMPDQYTEAQAFADACVERYVKSGYRSKGKYDSPGQKTFGFATPRTKPFRDWSFEEEQKHPRGQGGKFRNKWGIQPSKKKDLPLFDQPKQKQPEPFNDSHLKKISDWMEKLGHKAAGTGAIKAAGLTPEQAKSTTLSPDQQMTVLFNLGVLGKEGFEKHLWGHTSDTDPKPMDLPRFLIRLSSAMHKHSDQAKRQAAAQRIPEGAKMVLFNNPRGSRLLLHPATRADRRSEWQLTMLGNDNQPIGHTNPDSFEEGVHRALGVSDSHLENEHGYDIEWTNKDGKPAPYSMQTVERFTLINSFSDAFCDHGMPERYAQLQLMEGAGKSLQPIAPSIQKPAKPKGRKVPTQKQMRQLAVEAVQSGEGLWDYLESVGHKVSPEDRKPGGKWDTFIKAANQDIIPSGTSPGASVAAGRQTWVPAPGPRGGKRWYNTVSQSYDYFESDPNKAGAKRTESTPVETEGVSQGPESKGEETRPTVQPKEKKRATPPTPDQLYQKAREAGRTLNKLDRAATEYQYNWDSRLGEEVMSQAMKLAGRAVSKRMASRGMSDSEFRTDVVQDTLLSTMQTLKKGRYDPSKASFSRLVNAIAGNSFLAKTKKEFGREHKGEKVGQPKPVSQMSDEDDKAMLNNVTDKMGNRNDWSPAMRNAFWTVVSSVRDKLNPESRYVMDRTYLAMRKGEEASTEELANDLGVSEVTVRKRAKNAAIKIRKAAYEFDRFSNLIVDLVSERKTVPAKEIMQIRTGHTETTESMFFKKKTLQGLLESNVLMAKGRDKEGNRLITLRKPRPMTEEEAAEGILRAIQQPDPTKRTEQPALLTEAVPTKSRPKPKPKKPATKIEPNTKGFKKIKQPPSVAGQRGLFSLAAQQFADAFVEKYVFGQFDPGQHPRAQAGDPAGAGGRFVSKHGPSPTGTQGVSLPKPTGAATKAIAAAAPPVPKPMKTILNLMGAGKQSKPPKQTRQKATTQTKRKNPHADLAGQLAQAKKKMETKKYNEARTQRLRDRERRLRTWEDKKQAEMKSGKQGAKKKSTPKPQTESQPSSESKPLPLESQPRPTGPTREPKRYPQQKKSGQSQQKQLQEVPESEREGTQSASTSYPMTSDVMLETMTPKEKKRAARKFISSSKKVSDSGPVRDRLDQLGFEPNSLSRHVARSAIHEEYNTQLKDWEDFTSELHAIMGTPPDFDKTVENKKKEIRSNLLRKGVPEPIVNKRVKEQSDQFARSKLKQWRDALMKGFAEADDPENIYITSMEERAEVDPKTKQTVIKKVPVKHKVSVLDDAVATLSQPSVGFYEGQSGEANFPHIYARLAGAKGTATTKVEEGSPTIEMGSALLDILQESYTDPASNRTRQTLPYKPSASDPDIVDSAIANSGIDEFKTDKELIDYLAKRYIESQGISTGARGESWESEDFTLVRSSAQRDLYTHVAAAYYNGGKVTICTAN